MGKVMDMGPAGLEKVVDAVIQTDRKTKRKLALVMWKLMVRAFEEGIDRGENAAMGN